MGLFSSKPDGAARTVKLVKDPSGAPAVDTVKVRAAGHEDLAKSAEKAGIALSKRNLSGIRAQAVVLLDMSGSMKRDYQSGAVQILLQRALGFSLQIDADGTVPVIPFDDRIRDTFDVNMGNFSTAANAVWTPNDMGSTNLAGALKVLMSMAKKTDAPIFACILTDGSPDDRKAATKVVCELAGYPVFLKFMALRPVDYLSELDDLEQSQPGARLLDNVDAKPERGSSLNLLSCTDLEFQDAMADEFDTWTQAATTHGILAV